MHHAARTRTLRVCRNALATAAMLAAFQGVVASTAYACSVGNLYVSPSGSDVANTCTTAATPCATIAHAVDQACAGATINVRPGTYNESAPIDSPPGCPGDTVGIYFPIGKPGLIVRGVTAADVPITSAASVAATVNTVSNLCFGPDGVFVEADNAKLAGIRIGTNTGGQNKTIEVVGDNFTLENCDIADPQGSVYLNDFAFDSEASTSHLQSYTIQGNLFQDGVSLDIASGAGFSGPVSGRNILNNSFANSQSWPSISFSGADTGVPWFVYSVGGAVIQGNTFSNTNAAGQIIRARGTYDNTQFDWASFWNDNTFDKAVVVGATPPSDVRTFSYTSGPYTFNDVRRIGAIIQGEIDHGQSGDTVLVGAGDYDESPRIFESLTLKSSAGRDLTNIHLQTGPAYLGALEIGGVGKDITVDGFTIIGRDAACPTLATTNVYVDPEPNSATVKNSRLRVGMKDDGCTTGDDGFGVITSYSETTDVTTVSVTDSIIVPLNAEGTRAFYINPGVNNFNFQRNTITGKFGRALTQAKNGLVEDNTVDGLGLGGNGLGAWGYPDADVWGATTFRHNVFANLGTAISLFEANDVTVECNRFDSNTTGVAVFDGYGATNFDPTSIDLHTNSFLDNSSNAVANSAATPGNVLAANNWWGCVAGPGQPGCDSKAGAVTSAPVATSVPGCVGCTDDAQCSDGLACTGAETCNMAGMCQSGTAVDCSGSADQCNDASCSEPSGSCVVTPKIDGFGCNDGSVCSSNDTCQAGVCVGSGGSGDADSDGYCDLQEQQAGCNPNDPQEIPPQANVYSGGRVNRGGEVLLTYRAPADRNVRVSSDASCATTAACSLGTGFCISGKVGDPCSSNAQCNQTAGTCRIVINYAATADLSLLDATVKSTGTPRQSILPLFTPATPGCSRKVDIAVPPAARSTIVRLRASGTTSGRLRRERDRIIYRP